MAFADRFVKVPIQVYDKKLKETADVDEVEDSWMKVNPLEIASYRPSWDVDDESKSELVSMTLKNGDTTLVYMTVKEFENLLNSWNL